MEQRGYVYYNVRWNILVIIVLDHVLQTAPQIQTISAIGKVVNVLLYAHKHQLQSSMLITTPVHVSKTVQQ